MISVELLYFNDRSWFEYCQKQLSNYPHWEGIFIQGSFKMEEADRLARLSINPLSKNFPYMQELRQICDDVLAQFSLDDLELVFVDPGICLRGDLVNIMMEKNVPIIASHDTNAEFAMYGWNRIIVPSHYQTFHFSKGVGLTFWVRKDCLDVIQCLEKTDHSPHELWQQN